MKKIKYVNKDNSFKRDLDDRIEKYFEQKGISKYGDWRLYIKTIFFFVLLPTLYVSLVFFTPENNAVALGLCVLLGLTFAGIGFDIMHDAAHGSFSPNRKLNNTICRILEFMLGVSIVVFWKKKHNFLHHSFVNTVKDEDISFYPLMRTLKDEHKKLPFHKYQHIYSPVLYSLLFVSWFSIMDLKKYFRQKVYGEKVKMTVTDHVFFWISKTFFVLAFIVLPGMLLGWQTMAIGFLTMGVTTGLVIAMIFQLAHVVESSTFPESPSGEIDIPWAESQMIETSDFAVNSKILSWYVGGLNFQSLHHQRSDISHVHYREISKKILAPTAKKHKVPYNKLGFLEAIASHFRTLKKLGVA